MFMRHVSGDVEQAVGSTSLEHRDRAACRAHVSRRLDELTQEANVVREQRRAQGCAGRCPTVSGRGEVEPA